MLGNDPRFVITPLPTVSNSRKGWAVGLAVKKGAKDLEAALQSAVDGLMANGQMQRIFARSNVGWHAV